MQIITQHLHKVKFYHFPEAPTPTALDLATGLGKSGFAQLLFAYKEKQGEQIFVIVLLFVIYLLFVVLFVLNLHSQWVKTYLQWTDRVVINTSGLL